jgi:hypothetical protein
MADGGPVPGRECGTCDACCVLFEIRDPRLGKPAGMRCSQLCDTGCATYESRPKPCSDWLCVWRLLPSLPEDWRPDLSGILLYQGKNNVPGYHDTALMLSLAHGLAHLEDEALLDFLLLAVQNRQPVYLGVHKLKDGKAASAADNKAVFVNLALERAWAREGRAGFVEFLKQTIETKLAQPRPPP